MRDHLLKEATKHGTPDFPVQYYYVDTGHPRYEMILHWHEEFEIVRVLEGELLLYIDNERHDMHAGDVAFVGCGCLHRAEPNNAIYECVVFDLHMLCRHATGRVTSYLLPLFDHRARLSLLRAQEQSDLHCAVASFFGVLASVFPYFEFKAYAAAAEIMYLLYAERRIRLPARGIHVGHKRESIARLIDWIEQNYAEHLTLSGLAAIVGINEKYLCRFFAEYTGSTPIEYVNRLRIERACYRLAEGELNITEVAFEVGFNDNGYFTKIFKRYKSMTPREYRTLLLEQASSQGE